MSASQQPGLKPDGMIKAINRFDPVRARSFEEAERHYLEIHHAFARAMHRASDAVLQYVPNRALAQYDVNGGFDQDPEAWRYVFHLRREDLPDAQSFIPEGDRQAIWADHTNCLRNIRALEVAPEVLADKCTGQMVFVKYVFEYHFTADVPAATAEAAYQEEHLPRLRALLGEAFGFRKCITNKALRQAVTAPLAEEGQILTGDYIDPESVYRIEEYWFDNAAWGADFFGDPRVRDLLRAPERGRMEGYLVEEKCGVDKF